MLATGAVGIGRFGAADAHDDFVVHGFTLGIGGMLLMLCTSHVLGLRAPQDLNATQVIDLVSGQVRQIRPAAIVIGVFTALATLIGMRLRGRVPAALLAILVATLATRFSHWTVATLPDLPLALASIPHVAAFPVDRVANFVAAALTLFGLATLETLLSASAESQRSPGSHHDPDQALVGHGIANVVIALLGGIPAAGDFTSCAPSLFPSPGLALALQHCFTPCSRRLLFQLSCWPIATSRWPRACRRGDRTRHSTVRPTTLVRNLAGFAVAIAGSVDHGKRDRGRRFAHGDRDRMLLVGRAGDGSDPLGFARRCTAGRAMDRTRSTFSLDRLPFSPVPELERLRSRLRGLDLDRDVILDMRDVLVMDVTGCNGSSCSASGRSDGAQRQAGHHGLRSGVPGHATQVGPSRSGLASPRLARRRSPDVRPRSRTQNGHSRCAHKSSRVFRKFRSEVREHYNTLFEQLADGQHPHTLFITCVDSRISPAMLTGSHPGEVFVVRCLGAMVPPPADDATPSEAAAIEYAVGGVGGTEHCRVRAFSVRRRQGCEERSSSGRTGQSAALAHARPGGSGRSEPIRGRGRSSPRSHRPSGAKHSAVSARPRAARKERPSN